MRINVLTNLKYFHCYDYRPAENPDRPLPRDPSQYSAEFVPAQMRLERPGVRRKTLPGKMTLDSSVNMITKFQQSPANYGPEQSSDEYKINRAVAANILRYYGIFNMMETNTRDTEMDKPHDPLIAGDDQMIQ